MNETPFQECQRVIRELRVEIERLKQACRDEAGVELSEENDRLIAQRDELLARLRAALHHVESEGDITLAFMIHETIAKVERK
jgi:hypothetical protein